MKQVRFFLPLLVMAVMLGGCPYTSEVPIDEPSLKVKNEMLGKWEKKSTDKDVYTISKADKFTYQIEKTGPDSKTPSVYKAFMSEVGGDIFMNMTETGGQSDGKTYILFKVETNDAGNKITLRGLTENIDEKFTSSAELKKFIKKYKGLSFFYDKDEDVFFKSE